MIENIFTPRRIVATQVPLPQNSVGRKGNGRKWAPSKTFEAREKESQLGCEKGGATLGDNTVFVL